MTIVNNVFQLFAQLFTIVGNSPLGRYAANPLGQPIGGHGIGPWEKGREGGPWNNPRHGLRTGVAWRVGKEPPKKRRKKGRGNKTKGDKKGKKDDEKHKKHDKKKDQKPDKKDKDTKKK